MSAFPRLLDYLSEDHIVSEDLQMVYDAIGHDAFVRLLEQCGGLRVSIPQPQRLMPLVMDYLKENYDPERKGALAVHIGISINTLHRLMRKWVM